MRYSAFCIVFALLLLAVPAEIRADDGKLTVPSAMQGIWAKEGRCDIQADRLKITADAAGFGDDPLRPVYYGREDKAVFWAEEYQTDNFVAGRNADFLVHNAQGFHMPGAVGYAKCGPDLARVPWHGNRLATSDSSVRYLSRAAQACPRQSALALSDTEPAQHQPAACRNASQSIAKLKLFGRVA